MTPIHSPEHKVTRTYKEFWWCEPPSRLDRVHAHKTLDAALKCEAKARAAASPEGSKETQ